MTAIPFPTTTAPGRKPQESGGRVINAYVEALVKSETRPIYYRVPGLERIVDVTAHVHCRGLHASGSSLLHVLDDRVYAVTESDGAFVATDLGALSGEDPVTIAQNVAASPNIVAVTDVGAFNLFTNSAPTSFADGDLPSTNSVAFCSGYFLFTTGDGKIYASGLNNVTVDALSFASAQQRGDGLLRGVAFRGEFFAFGQASCEVWKDAGTTPFPFQFVTMIPRGLAGKFAVAGWEEGWTNQLVWVGDDNVVYRLGGYEPVRVSTHPIERQIADVADKSTLRACVYQVAGHAFWSLSCSDWTLVLDLLTGLWSERHSYDSLRWRGCATAKAFDSWIVGDNDLGCLYRVTEGSREHNDLITWTVESDVSSAFPDRATISKADFLFTAGVGIANEQDPIGTDPEVSISWSNDGGVTWGSPVLRKLGQQSKAGTVVSVHRTGQATRYGRRWRISGSGPTHLGFQGGDMTISGA